MKWFDPAAWKRLCNKPVEKSNATPRAGWPVGKR